MDVGEAAHTTTMIPESETETETETHEGTEKVCIGALSFWHIFHTTFLLQRFALCNIFYFTLA